MLAGMHYGVFQAFCEVLCSVGFNICLCNDRINPPKNDVQTHAETLADPGLFVFWMRLKTRNDRCSRDRNKRTIHSHPHIHNRTSESGNFILHTRVQIGKR